VKHWTQQQMHRQRFCGQFDASGRQRTFRQLGNPMNRVLLTTMLSLSLALDSSAAIAQTITERLHSVSGEPGTPLIIGILGEPIPLSIDEFTKRSDLVLEARVLRLDTYVNAADTEVITDFQVQPIRILAGHEPIGTPLVLRTYGGEVIRDGVTIQAVNHNTEQLMESVVYLLFLKRFGPDASVYRILNVGAFEHFGGVARPLARQGKDLFRDFSGTYADVIARVKQSAHAK
jgi:hypothetical protein